MKTTKGGKVMNPTDAYRKELRKKELKRNKKERKKVREVGILKKDPESLKEQIAKLESQKAEGPLDKARKHRKRQLEDTLNLVLKKKKEYEEKQKEKGETTVMFSHLGPLRRRATAEEEERIKHPQPEDSVYYHPTLNPTGAPPPGKPPMFKSSIGPRIPFSAASSSGAASSSMSEADDAALQNSSQTPPQPRPPGEPDAGDASVIPASLPLPPPPPLPPKPLMTEQGIQLPTPPLPPPPPLPPGLPSKEIQTRAPLPPPPPLHQSAQPPAHLTGGSEKENSQSAKSDDQGSQDPFQIAKLLQPPPPPPPPPVRLPPNLPSNQLEGSSSDLESRISSQAKDLIKNIPPPPPPIRPQPPMSRPALMPALQQPDVLPPGIPSFPPPQLLLDARPSLAGPGIAGLPPPPPPGVMVPLIPRPPFGPPPGPPPLMRPPLPPGPPPLYQDDSGARLLAPQKPSYVKSAASTVVKRPLAQHTPGLTAMVPASVQVRRESVVPKAKSKPTTTTVAVQPVVSAPVPKQEPISSSTATKPQSVDDSYMAFLEDMKALGALDG